MPQISSQGAKVIKGEILKENLDLGATRCVARRVRLSPNLDRLSEGHKYIETL
jgi:hypothetical protein